jgi:hypothetical protein
MRLRWPGSTGSVAFTENEMRHCDWRQGYAGHTTALVNVGGERIWTTKGHEQVSRKELNEINRFRNQIWSYLC